MSVFCGCGSLALPGELGDSLEACIRLARKPPAMNALTNKVHTDACSLLQVFARQGPRAQATGGHAFTNSSYLAEEQ